MNSEELKRRTKEFALRIIRLVGALPPGRAADVIARQLMKSGTSIGANYREALRASSRKQFVFSLEIVQREAEETKYWLELLQEAELINPVSLAHLRDECNQLLAIFTATIRSAKQKKPES